MSQIKTHHIREQAPYHTLSKTGVLSTMLDGSFCGSQSKGCRLQGAWHTGHLHCLWATVIPQMDIPVALQDRRQLCVMGLSLLAKPQVTVFHRHCCPFVTTRSVDYCSYL
ncbi:hypothetical protein TNCV_1752781 [Trichonephila clavipes]|nr:hypothetical protein TNCV_1752781 [Trichonephila clavipes]